MGWISFQFYRWFALPVALFFLHAVQIFLPKKLRLIIDQRSDEVRVSLNNRPVWIHASSGEIEYAKPVIRAIRNQWPERSILVTYFSPSAEKLIKNLPVDGIIPLPWDTRSQVKHFLNHYQPLVALIARTDVWPEFSYQIRQRDIPSLLFSSNQPKKEVKSNLLVNFAHQQLSDIFTVSEMGDTRFDQVLYRLQNPNPVKIQPNPQAKQVLIAGSTWPQDEEILLPAVDQFVASGGQVILAPHEVSQSRIENLQQELNRLGFTFCLYSKTEVFNKQIMIVDQIGILADLYKMGELAFVGGSFRKKVHSVMEPLAAGLSVIVGPYYTNNTEAELFRHKALADQFHMVNVVKSSSEIRNLISKWPTNKKLIQSEVQKMSGATEHVIQWLDLKFRNVHS